MSTTLRPGDALVIVDVQHDFLPGGALGVPHGDEIIAVLNRYLRLVRTHHLSVYASRDWHPGDHCSFASRGGPWPAHCVAGTPGAAFDPRLELPAGAVVVSKATTTDADAYSAFSGTDLAQQLRACGVRRLLVGGLATDYCVVNTVLDGLAAGFEALVLVDAIRAVDVNPGDGARAIAKMREAGAVFVRYEDFAP